MQHIYIGCIIEKRTNRTRHLILFIRFASTLKCSCFPEEGSCSLSSSCWSSQAPEAAWSRAAGEAPALCLQDVPLPCGQWQQPLPKHVTLNALPLGSFHQGGILLFHKLLLETAPLSSCPANPACCQAHQAVCPIPLPAKDNSDHFHHPLSRTLVGWWALASALFRMGVTLEAGWKSQPRRTAILGSERNDAVIQLWHPQPPFPKSIYASHIHNAACGRQVVCVLSWCVL